MREAAANLQARLPIAAKLELARLGHLMKGDGSTFGSSLAAAHDYYMKISADAGNIITQNILINATRDAAADAFAFRCRCCIDELYQYRQHAKNARSRGQ